MRELTFVQAINEGIRKEARRAPNTVLMGEEWVRSTTGAGYIDQFTAIISPPRFSNN
jgi:pyruvate/2-oxoglutarate/acetoin dehydrogenase E1 component